MNDSYNRMQNLLVEAYQCQDACNLSGVVHSFSRAMTELREICPDLGTQFYNEHPIAILYASKIHSLAIRTNAAESHAFNLGHKATEKANERLL